MSDLDPEDVHARLEQLRALYVPETVDEGRARLDRERPRSRETFDERAARCLAELHALLELARHVQR